MQIDYWEKQFKFGGFQLRGAALDHPDHPDHRHNLPVQLESSSYLSARCISRFISPRFGSTANTRLRFVWRPTVWDRLQVVCFIRWMASPLIAATIECRWKWVYIFFNLWKSNVFVNSLPSRPTLLLLQAWGLGALPSSSSQPEIIEAFGDRFSRSMW